MEQGGILIGISAGSSDENLVGIEDKSSLGLVDFEFMPHWSEDDSIKYLELLKDYSKSQNTIVYACADSDGIVIDGDEIKFIGNIIKI